MDNGKNNIYAHQTTFSGVIRLKCDIMLDLFPPYFGRVEKCPLQSSILPKKLSAYTPLRTRNFENGREMMIWVYENNQEIGEIEIPVNEDGYIIRFLSTKYIWK